MNVNAFTHLLNPAPKNHYGRARCPTEMNSLGEWRDVHKARLALSTFADISETSTKQNDFLPAPQTFRCLILFIWTRGTSFFPPSSPIHASVLTHAALAISLRQPYILDNPLPQLRLPFPNPLKLYIPIFRDEGVGLAF